MLREIIYPVLDNQPQIFPMKEVKEFLKWLFDEKAKYFYGGAVAGLAPGAIFLLDASVFSGHILMVIFLLKLVGAIVIAFGTGIASALASDAYKWAKEKSKKVRFFNRKKIEDESKQKSA